MKGRALAQIIMKVKISRGLALVLASLWSVFLFIAAYIYQTKVFELDYAHTFMLAGGLSLLFYIWQLIELALPKKDLSTLTALSKRLLQRNLGESLSWTFLAASAVCVSFLKKDIFMLIAAMIALLTFWGVFALFNLILLKPFESDFNVKKSFLHLAGHLNEGTQIVYDDAVKKACSREIKMRFNSYLRRFFVGLSLLAAALAVLAIKPIFGVFAFVFAAVFFLGYTFLGIMSFWDNINKVRWRNLYLLSAPQILGFYQQIYLLEWNHLLKISKEDQLNMAYGFLRVEAFNECLLFLKHTKLKRYRLKATYYTLAALTALGRREDALKAYDDLDKLSQRLKGKKSEQEKLILNFFSAILWKRYDQAQFELDNIHKFLSEEEDTLYQAFITEKVI